MPKYASMLLYAFINTKCTYLIKFFALKNQTSLDTGVYLGGIRKPVPPSISFHLHVTATINNMQISCLTHKYYTIATGVGSIIQQHAALCFLKYTIRTMITTIILSSWL